MARFRMRLLRRICGILIFSTVIVIIMVASFAALSTVRETKHTGPYNIMHRIEAPSGNSSRTHFANVMPPARDTKHITREVPKQSTKGLPGRWLHSSGSMGLTYYKTSNFSLSTDRATVRQGQIFQVVLQACDKSGRPRLIGGDFWYATLTSEGRGSTAGRFVDHGNGTYSVYFFAGWPGNARIVLTLVHPSEAVDYLLHTVWHAEDRIVWIGRFDDGHTQSLRSCVFRRGGPWTDKCELTHQFALGKTVLLCDNPEHGLKCDSLVAIFNNNTRIRERARELTSNKYGALFGNEYYTKGLAPKTIEIENASPGTMDDIHKQLPECEPDQPRPLTSGYWAGNSTWVSLACRTKQWKTADDIGACLRNKKVYLLGDSTSRQWFEVLSGMLGVPFQRQNLLEQNNIYRRFDKFNLTTFFKFHPLCLTGNKHPTPFNLFSFEADVLDTLKDKDCGYVMLVSPWAHYPQWTKDMFLERVSLLREALLRFRERCPDVPIVVKGPHPRNQPGIEGKLFFNNFMLYQLGKILQETFSGLQAWFLDIWDVNTAHPHAKVMHMPDQIVKQELSMFLSYVCRKIK